MKKIVFILAALLLTMTTCAHAADFRIFELRNKIFEESKQIKALMPTSKESFILLVLFDSCVLTASQIDAYFSMMRIVNTIRSENLSKEAIDSLIAWLEEMKKGNEINFRMLDDASIAAKADTKAHIAKLREYYALYGELVLIDANRLNALRKVARPAKTKR